MQNQATSREVSAHLNVAVAVEPQVTHTVMTTAWQMRNHAITVTNHISQVCMERSQQIHSDTSNPQDLSVRCMCTAFEDDHGESYVFYSRDGHHNRQNR